MYIPASAEDPREALRRRYGGPSVTEAPPVAPSVQPPTAPATVRRLATDRERPDLGQGGTCAKAERIWTVYISSAIASDGPSVDGVVQGGERTTADLDQEDAVSQGGRQRLGRGRRLHKDSSPWLT